MSTVDRTARAGKLLADGDWVGAKELFEESLLEDDRAEVLSGLGEALFWLGDFARAFELRERAYVSFRENGDKAAAARMAMWLATEHVAVLGNEVVGNGWLARAERLLDEAGPCAERGWLILRRSRQSPDPIAAEQLARDALDVATAHADHELEVAAISQRGRALLAAGRTEEAFVCLDEAMAAATSGELQSPDTITATCCDMIGACERTMEIERATQWCQVTDDYARRYKFRPLFAFCRVTYASVLIAVGRWDEAERELCTALQEYRASMASRSYFAVAKLAELRLLQGRDAEAEELLQDLTQNPMAAKALGMLYLARGDAPTAVRVLGKRLAAVENDLLAAAPLLVVMVDAQLACDDIDAAGISAQRLTTIATKTKRAAFMASAAHARGLVKLTQTDRSALEDFEEAVEAFTSAGMPLGGARARLGIARCLAGDGGRTAKDECRRAVAILEELGAKRDLDAAAELRRGLGVGARVGPRVAGSLTRREEEVLSLLPLGLSNAKIGARLFISPKTVEHHVGNILGKLGIETRAAAAAYAAKAAPKKPGTK